jgi:hypothetical protein
VVDLESFGHIASGDDALVVPVLHGTAQMSRNGASDMTDRRHVDSFGDDHLQDGVAQHVDRRGQRHRTDPRNLAALPVLEVSPTQRGQVDP